MNDPVSAAGHKADIAIDLGTANTIVIKKGTGVIFDEPTICCFDDKGARKLVAAGTDANRMVGRVTHGLRIARPLRGGVLSDFDAGKELLRYATRSARSRWPGKRLNALIGIPADATQAERSALRTAAQEAGMAKVDLLPEPLLAAIGIGLDVAQPRGRMLVDCGAGTTEVAVISLGAICVSRSVRIGGDTLDEALMAHLHLRHRFEIGLAVAEGLNREVAAFLNQEMAGRTLFIRGRNLSTGLPETLELPCSELLVVYERHLLEIVETILAALLETPPELSRDILEDGITVTGGASTIRLLKDLISAKTGLAVHVPAEPLKSVAAGLEILLDRID